MKTTKAERVRAEQISAAVDRLVGGLEVQSTLEDPSDAGLVSTARQLAQLPELLGPVEPALEQQVMRQVRGTVRPWRRTRRVRLGWAAVGVACVLVLALLLTSLGRSAVAGLLAVFDLGRTEVRIAPSYTPRAVPATAATAGTAVEESLSLEEAQQQTPFRIPQPAYMPSGYDLRTVSSYTFPDLPAWVPQPFFVELVYGDGQGGELVLRVYPIMLGDEASIAGLNLEAASIQDVQDVEVDGQPAVLLRLGFERTGAVWTDVVWEQDDLILGLSSLHLDEAELLRVARSVR